jgi:hypothetical protein
MRCVYARQDLTLCSRAGEADPLRGDRTRRYDPRAEGESSRQGRRDDRTAVVTVGKAKKLPAPELAPKAGGKVVPYRLEAVTEEAYPQLLDQYFVIPALESGDPTWIIKYIRDERGALTPRLRQLFLDLLENKWRWPAHRVKKRKTAERDRLIAKFVLQRADEGEGLKNAKEQATKKFNVSLFTVRNALAKWGPSVAFFEGFRTYSKRPYK